MAEQVSKKQKEATKEQVLVTATKVRKCCGMPWKYIVWERERDI